VVALARKLLHSLNWAVHAAQQFGADPDFASVPPNDGFWLGKRAKIGLRGVPYSYRQGMMPEMQQGWGSTCVKITASVAAAAFSACHARGCSGHPGKMWEVEMTITKPLLLLGLVASATPAAAETAAGAMETFGLVGTWSIDCSVDVMKPCATVTRCFARLVFATPLVGAPTHEIIGPTYPNGLSLKSITKIESAIQVTDDKIKITESGTIDPKAPGASRLPIIGEQWDYVFVRVGGHLRLWSAQRIDGMKIRALNGYYYVPESNWRPEDGSVKGWQPTTQETEDFEKCLN